MSGLYTALNLYAELSGKELPLLPATSAFGSLIRYATDPATSDYQPMHVNYGLFPPLGGPRLKKRERFARFSRRALDDLDAYLATRPELGCPGASAATEVGEGIDG